MNGLKANKKKSYGEQAADKLICMYRII